MGIAENAVREENVENVETHEETVHARTLEPPANLSDTHDTHTGPGIVVDVDDERVKRKQRDALKSDEQWFDLIGDETPVMNPIPIIHAITDNITNLVCREAVAMADSVSEVHLSYVTTYHNFLTLLTNPKTLQASVLCMQKDVVNPNVLVQHAFSSTAKSGRSRNRDAGSNCVMQIVPVQKQEYLAISLAGYYPNPTPALTLANSEF